MIKIVSLFLFHSLFISIVLTLCDFYCHTKFGVLFYHSVDKSLSFFPDHPTYDILLNFFGIGLYCTFTGYFIFNKMKPISNIQTFISFVVFISFYYLSGLLKDHPMTLHNLFLIVWVLQLVGFKRETNKLLQYSIFLGVLGPVVEGYYSGVIGFFSYTDVDAYYVPLWLCGLYLNGALVIAATTSKIGDYINNNNKNDENNNNENNNKKKQT